MKRLFNATACLMFASLSLSACGDNQSGGGSDVPPDPPVIEEISKDVAVLPNHSYKMTLTNPEQSVVNVEPYKDNVANITILSRTEIAVNGLNEGNTSISVYAGNYHYTINVECLDLQFTMADTGLEIGSLVPITINKNVTATYSLDNHDVAEILSGYINIKAEGTFTLTATYKEISISKTFEVSKGGEVPPTPVIEEITKDITILPNRSYKMVLTNPKEDTIVVDPYTSGVANITIFSRTEISVNGLTEGKTSLSVHAGLYHYTINVECIDLQFTMDDEDLEIGSQLQISLNRNVSATYSIDNQDVAEIVEGIIVIKAEGVFTLTAVYKEITISKTFEVSGEVPPEPPVVEDITKDISLLLNHSAKMSVINPTLEDVEIEAYESDVASITVLGPTELSVNGLKEGAASIRVNVGNHHYTINVECIDLQFDMKESYVEKGATKLIKLNRSVNVTYAVDNPAIAEIVDGSIHAKEEGVFTLTANYKDISISQTFDTYVRKSTIDVLDRNNPLIHYIGRNFHANKVVQMDNEGSGFEVYFKGTYLKANLAAKYANYYGKTRISVLLDDETDTTKRVIELTHGSTESEYVLISNLNDGYHRVRVLKRTEVIATYMTLSSLSTDGKFHPVNSEDKLKMEVYGDSITAGYGNLRGNLPDQTSAPLQSGLQTYASYTALALGAELNIQARSGIGIYTANNDIGAGNHISDHFDKVTFEGKLYWNFSNYVPDIVLINAGTNDYWDSTHFTETTLIEKYVGFVKSLVENYGRDVKFILLSGLMEQEVNSFVLKIRNRLVNEITNQIYTYQFHKCASGHPLAAEHALASDELVSFMRRNGLDVIPTREHEEKVIPEISGETVNTTVSVELQDMIKEGSKLYVNYGDNQKQELTQIDRFHYSFDINAVEQDLEVYFTIDDNEEYKSDDYIVHIRKGYSEKLVLNTFLASPEIEEDVSQFGWIMTDHLYDGSFVAADESNLTAINKNWLAGLVVRNSEQGDNFKLSATIKSESEITNFTSSYIGLVPYYVDESNFVVVYMQWNEQNQIRGIGCTGIIDGQDIGWNDFFSISGFEVDLVAGVDLEVTRNDQTLKVTLNSMSEEKDIAGMSGDTNKVGVWFYEESCAISYSNFLEEHYDRPVSKEWVYSWHLSDGTMTPNSETSVTLYNSNNWMAGFAVQETAQKDNYKISVNMYNEHDNFIDTDDVTLGIVPYFVNENNFVVLYFQWLNTGKIKSIGCTGRINGVDLGWNDIWAFANVDSALSQSEAVEVTRQNKTLTVKYKGVTGSVTIGALDGLSTKYIGFYSNKTTTTFSNVTVTPAN